MGAFSIAFDIIVVGALALPWVLLSIHLFFSDNESSLKKLFDWVEEQQQPALAGILLFAMAFPLGSVVSRMGQDFFDDDDLHIQVFHHLLRVGVTESSIRTDVFCNSFKPDPTAPKPGNPLTEPEQSKTSDSKSSDPVAERGRTFRATDPNCAYTGRWIIRTPDPDTHQPITAEWISDQQERAGLVFHVHEAAVLLKGTDATERIRQFHDQIMVLRGAAFNGMIAFSLCLFWWASKFPSAWRWMVLAPHLFLGGVASVNHALDHAHDPPYMEFTFLVLAAAGGRLLWQRRPKRNEAQADLRVQNGRGEVRFSYLVLATFLTFTALLGWWATQVLYDQQVIYSYRALSEVAAK